MHYRKIAVWMLWNTENGLSLNSRDSFPRRKFKNWAETSDSPGPILSPPTISFELHGKVAETDRKCAVMGNCRKFKCSVTLTLTWIGSRSHQHTQYVQNYQHAQPSDRSIMHYRNMAVWILWNMDNGQSLNSRDSFLRRKFKNRAKTSCSLGPILSSSTISFELHAKTAEEINL